MDNQSIELSTLPPSYSEAVMNEPKGQQHDQNLQPRNEVYTQLLGEIQRMRSNENMLTREPMTMQCPHCEHNIQTNIISSACTITHIIFAILCSLGCWCCSFIPYYCNSFKGIKHYCSNCNGYIGKNRLIPKTEIVRIDLVHS